MREEVFTQNMHLFPSRSGSTCRERTLDGVTRPIPHPIPIFFSCRTGSPMLVDVKLCILGLPFLGSEGDLLGLLSLS